MSRYREFASDKSHSRHGVSRDGSEGTPYAPAIPASVPLPLPTVGGDDWRPNSSKCAHHYQGSKRTANPISLDVRGQSHSQPCARRSVVSAGASESNSGATTSSSNSPALMSHLVESHARRFDPTIHNDGDATSNLDVINSLSCNGPNYMYGTGAPFATGTLLPGYDCSSVESSGSPFSSVVRECPSERPGNRNARPRQGLNHPGAPWNYTSTVSSYPSSPPNGMNGWQHASDHISQSAKGSSNVPPSNASVVVSAAANSAKRTASNGQMRYGGASCPRTSSVGHLSQRTTSQAGVDGTTSYECSVAHRENVSRRAPTSCQTNSTNNLTCNGADINASSTNSNSFHSTSRRFSTKEGGMSYLSSFSYRSSHTPSGGPIQGSVCSSSHACTSSALPPLSAGSTRADFNGHASSRPSNSDSRPLFDLPDDTVTMVPLETDVGLSKEKVNSTSGDNEVAPTATCRLEQCAPSKNQSMVRRTSASQSNGATTCKDRSSSTTISAVADASDTVATAAAESAPSSPIECLRDRVREARRKQVEDAEKFLKDKGVYNAEGLPGKMTMDRDDFLPRAKAVKKALEPFIDDADCPFVDTYEGKIKNLATSQLRHFLYCIERNFRFDKTGSGASHGSIDEGFLRPYLLSSSAKKALEAETLETARSITHAMDSNGFVNLSHAELHAQFIGSHASGVSAANSVFGRKVLRKCDVSESKGGLSLEQVANAVRKGPLGISCEIKHDSRDVIRLQRESTSLGIDGVSRMKSIVNCKEGILLVSALASGAEKCSKVGHFFVVNGLMQSILDCQNGKGHCISYAGIDANNTAFVKKFFRAFNVIDIRRVYRVQVRVDRIPECFPSFIGSVNGVFYGIQPERLPGPLDAEASNIDASHAKKNDGELLVSTVKMEGFGNKDGPKPLKRNTHTSKRKAADGDIEGADSATKRSCHNTI